MPDKYRRYRNGGGVMGLSERVRKNIRRDIDRGGPDPKAEFRAKLEQRKTMRPESILDGFIDPIIQTGRSLSDGLQGYQEGGGILSRIGRIRERSKERAQELEDILAANPNRRDWPQFETPDRDIPYSGTADQPFLRALQKEIGREGRFSFRDFVDARRERRGRSKSGRPMTLEGWRGPDWKTGIEHTGRWYRDQYDAEQERQRQADLIPIFPNPRPITGKPTYGNVGEIDDLFLKGEINQEQYDAAIENQRQGYDRLSIRDLGEWIGEGDFDAEASLRRRRRPGHTLRHGPAPRASGGIIGLQTGGIVRMAHGGAVTPQPGAAGAGQAAVGTFQPGVGGIPANYAAPQSYGGYGMPAQFAQRQEYLSPEVAQQYAALTRGIMQAGTRGYEDVRYKGPQLAGFTGMEAAAQAGAGAYGRGAGPQGTLQAASTIGEAARGIGSIIPEQEALARQYGTMATGAKGLGTTAATEQARIAGLMEASGTAAKATGTAAETAFKGVGTGIQGLADPSAVAQRGYGTAVGALGTATAAAQRGYGTAAGTATGTSLGLQRAKAAQDYATQSALKQRALGAELGAPELQKKADLSEYMSQYTQGVTGPQLQQLMEFQKMQGQELGSQAAAAGAFGGLRQGVQAATQAQDVSQQAADIIGKSQQEAFQSAQAAQAADVARTQAGQQAKLAAERGALAAETGQQATQLSAEQQALRQQMEQEQFGAAQEQAAHQAAMGAQQFGLSAEQAAHQTAVGGRQANLAAQQAALTAAQQGRSQYEGALTGAAGLADVGTGRQLQGYATAADMMGGQGRAMSAGLGAYGQLAGIGGQQMGLGGQQQAEQMARFDMMNRYGGQQRRLQQAGLDITKAEHEKAMQYPERQIGWMSQQLGALPYQNIVSESTYAPQAGPVSTTLGALTGGAEAAAAWRAKQPDAAQQPGANLGARTPTGGRIPDPTVGMNTGLGYADLSSGTSITPGGQTGMTGSLYGSAWGAPPPTPGPPPPPGPAPPAPNLGLPGTTPPAAGGGLIGGYQGGGYMPFYSRAGGGYVPYAPGIIGVGRGMGR